MAGVGGGGDGGEVGEDRPLVEATGGDHGEDALDIAAARAGLRAEAEFSPDDGGPDGLFGAIIGGLEARDPHEGPEGGFVVDEPLAGGGRVRVGGGRALAQQGADLRLDRDHGLLERGEGERPVADAPPERKQLRDVLE